MGNPLWHSCRSPPPRVTVWLVTGGWGEGLAGGPSRVTGAAADRRRADTPAHREGVNSDLCTRRNKVRHRLHTWARRRGMVHALHLFMGLAALLWAWTAAAQQPVVYPAKGQSAQQQSQDETQCNAWAKQSTGID